MATTRDIINEYIDLENELEYDEDNKEISSNLIKVQSKMKNKVEGIDNFCVELSRQKNLMDAEIKTLMDELKRLRSRKKAVQKTEEYLNKTLIPMVVKTMGEDGVFRTDTTRYKLYETWGPLNVIDEDAVPDKYKRAKIEVDKKGAREDVIKAAENGIGIAGLSIEKVDRIRRS